MKEPARRARRQSNDVLREDVEVFVHVVARRERKEDRRRRLGVLQAVDKDVVRVHRRVDAERGVALREQLADEGHERDGHAVRAEAAQEAELEEGLPLEARPLEGEALRLRALFRVPVAMIVVRCGGRSGVSACAE